MAEIVIKNLRKEFGDFTAVQSSSFKIEDGEFFMLLGPSGCGKTTTLRMIAGLELPTSGEIYIDKEEVGQKPARQRDIAFVFQMFALYPHMNVRRNISYPLISQGMSKRQVKDKVAEVSRILGIEDILDRPVSGLSGGDRQRVALGRAIVREPKAFMMDEPLGALDAEFREHMAEELRALHDRMGATTVYVTHDQLEAMQMGDKIVVMNHGVIEQFGTPQDIYDKPATMFVADFIGSPSMNFLRFHGEVHAGSSNVRLHHVDLAVPTVREPFQGDLVYGIRPEHISLRDEGDNRGEVVAAEYLGTTQIVTVKTSGGNLKARIASDQPAKPGETVALEFNGTTATLFDNQSGRALRSDLNEGILSHV
ncbi:multiple sugar transport system ATP-binding protein [Labrenzia sp. EL_208]|nr:multiple sugar transport system ATP-binding protein [Labrenzia sp. EL_142]MBG6157502.1 multiple sugar transport system ATP-binding protein [Labrenzia sp. EL_162]MBG6162936.1 multiple sugar transport system ATP-binding protein [Labrenzia sp. EL_195]MBG6174670.1 multiple sugar transport system ATP-binding protein [Labrenzia sp. EL_132]MBG6196104.1 multiple sugar transport system ATP-binding protein [Labrenzia sp. EL_159]MBG6229048.1 multiple sugar transport system ATP-binding protein [Labrenz